MKKIDSMEVLKYALVGHAVALALLKEDGGDRQKTALHKRARAPAAAPKPR